MQAGRALIVWGMLFWVFTSPLHAGISVLTPSSGRVRGKKKVVLVVQGPRNGMKVYSEGESPPLNLLKKVPSKGGEAVYHFLYTLRKGRNDLRFEPGSVHVRLVYSSSNRGGGGALGSYVFHKSRIEKRCRPCHTFSSSLKKKEKLPCLSCHKRLFKGRPLGHGPAENGNCLVCHRSTLFHGVRFALRHKGEELCFQCHGSSKRWKRMAYLHGPVGAGNCVFCHDPHGSSTVFYLRFGGKESLCLVCHQDKKAEFSKESFKYHAILSARGCTVCHDPHASAHPFQLMKDVVPLCVECHPKFRGRKRGHPLANHPLYGKKDPRRPQKRFTCVSCHDPHGSVFSSLLIAPQGRRLCSLCHPY